MCVQACTWGKTNLPRGFIPTINSLGTLWTHWEGFFELIFVKTTGGFSKKSVHPKQIFNSPWHAIRMAIFGMWLSGGKVLSHVGLKAWPGRTIQLETKTQKTKQQLEGQCGRHAEKSKTRKEVGQHCKTDVQRQRHKISNKLKTDRS